jgi:hypothetical protein
MVIIGDLSFSVDEVGERDLLDGDLESEGFGGSASLVEVGGRRWIDGMQPILSTYQKFEHGKYEKHFDVGM